MRALTLAFVLIGCGSTPSPKPAAVAPASEGGVAAPAPPNPCTANPCDATTIDPAVNPCAGAAAERGAQEGDGERR